MNAWRSFFAYMANIKNITFGSAATIKGSFRRLAPLCGNMWRLLSFSPMEARLLPEKVLCASIEIGYLFFARGSGFLGRIKLRDIKKYSLGDGYPQPESLASSVSMAVREVGSSETRVTLIIPKAWAVVRTVELPSTVRDTLSDVVSYELDRFTPFSATDALYDFRVLREQNGKLIIMIAAVKADRITPYVTALRDKGFNVDMVTLDLLCICGLLSYSKVSSEGIFIETHERGYDGALFSGSLPEITFAGIFQSGDDRARADMTLAEIAPLRELAGRQNSSSKVISHINNLSSTFKELLKVKLPQFVLDETSVKLRPSDGREFSYKAIGGIVESLWPGAAGVNLLSRGKKEVRKTPLGLTVILVLAIIAVLIFYAAAPIKIESARISDLDARIAVKKSEVKKVEELRSEVKQLREEIATIDAFSQRGYKAMDVLKELTKSLPPTVWLTRVKITTKTVDIEGYAASATGILVKLEASKYFKKTEFASPTFRDTRMNADRFSIKMELEGPANEEVKDKDEEVKVKGKENEKK